MVRNPETVEDLSARLREGDDRAAEAIHRRYVHRLVVLASRQFDPWLRSRADHEDVVQSVFKSFFARSARAEFDFQSWDSVWTILALITVRKCRRRSAELRAGRRDAAREVEVRDWEWVGRRDPTPDEAAVLSETLASWLAAMPPVERAVVQLEMQGLSTSEIARQIERTERTVRRNQQSARERLHTLLETAN